MIIKKKDVFILEIIEKLTVVTSTNLTILAGYHDVSVVRKRLKALVIEGYISEQWLNNGKIYYLTNKGCGAENHTSGQCLEVALMDSGVSVLRKMPESHTFARLQ